jgi:hypothetical protein
MYCAILLLLLFQVWTEDMTRIWGWWFYIHSIVSSSYFNVVVLASCAAIRILIGLQQNLLPLAFSFLENCFSLSPSAVFAHYSLLLLLFCYCEHTRQCQSRRRVVVVAAARFQQMHTVAHECDCCILCCCCCFPFLWHCHAFFFIQETLIVCVSSVFVARS